VDYTADRRRQLIRSLPDGGIDALLISNPINVSYLTGFSGDSSYLVLASNRELLISDARFTKQLSEECPDLETHIRPTAQNVLQATAEVLNKLTYRSIGFESAHLTVAERETLQQLAPALAWKGDPGRVEKMRAVKDPSEVAEIREAITIAERAFSAFRALLRPLDTEKDLCDALEQYVRRFGGQSTCFPSIVAIGERSALPHAPPTARSVSQGDFLLVDWGVSGRFYKSDLTRVLVTRKNSAFSRTPGAPTEAKLQEIYRVVLQAQEEAVRQIRPGVEARNVDAAARRVIAEAGFADFFGHGLGHGLGLQVHEAPAVRPNSDAILQPGMVVTIEPGIYLPGWGGVRIEDDVLVTSEGYEVLSHLPKDWQSAFCDF
jgi:Xaa-Pro aminopeptidase